MSLNAATKIICPSASTAAAAANIAKADGKSVSFEVVDGIYGRTYAVVVSL